MDAFVLMKFMNILNNMCSTQTWCKRTRSRIRQVVGNDFPLWIFWKLISNSLKPLMIIPKLLNDSSLNLKNDHDELQLFLYCFNNIFQKDKLIFSYILSELLYIYIFLIARIEWNTIDHIISSRITGCLIRS